MKTKKINEADLRKIINKKVYESLNSKMYYVIDEATEEVIENNSDLQSAIEDAKQLALKGGCYLVIDKNDNVYYKTSEESYKFEESKKIRFNESDVTRIVYECVKNTLNEIGDTKWGSYRLGAVAARNSKKAIDAKTPQDRLKYHKTVRDALNTFDKASNRPNGERDSKLSKAFKRGLAAGQKLEEDNEGMSPEEQEFRANLPKMFIQNEDEFEYIGKMPNGNTMIKYLGMPFEVTPQGRMLPAKNLNEDVESSNGLFSEPIENIRIGDEIIKIAQAASNISRVLAAYTEDDPSDYDFGYNYLEEWANRVTQEAESFAHDYTPEAYSK